MNRGNHKMVDSEGNITHKSNVNVEMNFDSTSKKLHISITYNLKGKNHPPHNFWVVKVMQALYG